MRGLLLAVLLPTAILAQSRGDPVDPNGGGNNGGRRFMVVGGVMAGGGGVGGVAMVPGVMGPVVAPGMWQGGMAGGGGGGMGGGDPIHERRAVKERTTHVFPGIQRARVVGKDTT